MNVTKYRKEYVVKSYEVDCHSSLRLLSLMNFLQDIAVENAEVLGLGFSMCYKNGLAWVGSNYELKIDRLPKLNEHITIETWPSITKLWGAMREFLIYDEDNQVIVRASSQWVLVDYERRRPVMLRKYIPDYEGIAERVLDTDFAKIEVLDKEKQENSIKVRFDDIDVNQHVNNAVYPLWASECVDNQYRLSHYPQELSICFKREALLGETVKIVSQIDGDESRHFIYNSANDTELAQCRIRWKEITSK